VPFIVAGKHFRHERNVLRTEGVLGDIAPTILALMGKEHPEVMTGRSLFRKQP
jgi:bisphosphoglycerate-independent phosphoglycerate mutase (AlkP superfamily)